MATATFNIHGNLNFFLHRRHKNKPIIHTWGWKASIKDMIESLGVPHPEIDLLIVNGMSVNFDTIMQDDDDVHVYPIPYYETHPHENKVRQYLATCTVFVFCHRIVGDFRRRHACKQSGPR